MNTQVEEVAAEEVAEAANAVHAKIIDLADEVGELLSGHNIEVVASAIGLHLMRLEQVLPGIAMQVAQSAITAATAQLPEKD